MDVLFVFVYPLLALCTVIQCSVYCVQSLKHLKNGNVCIQYFIYLLFFLFYIAPIISQMIFVGYEYEVFWRANDAMKDFVSNIEYLAFVLTFSYFIMKSSKKDVKMQNTCIEINHSITRFGSLVVVFCFILTIALSGIEVLIGGYGYAYINNEVVSLNEGVIGAGIIGYLIVLGNLRFVSRTKIVFLTIIVFCFFWIEGKRAIIAETMILIICVLGITKYISGKKMVQYVVVACAVLLPLCFLYGLLFKENTTSFLDYFNVDFSRQYTLVYQFYCDRIGRDISINPYDGIVYLLTFFVPRILWFEKPYPFVNYLTLSLVGQDFVEFESAGWATTCSIFSDLYDSLSILGLALGIVMFLKMFKKVNNEKRAHYKIMWLYIIVRLLTVQISSAILQITVMLILVFLVDKLFKNYVRIDIPNTGNCRIRVGKSG
ncbi:hypothetical protein [Bacteroides oleiciplenus]|uniref:hypothetical protein n=1 Tax=Bacteroides oleiciplenus TaxID=626931 RepID=UPI0026DAA08A|nr:hypothetical protein [Bacteroides oleiciplenus]